MELKNNRILHFVIIVFLLLVILFLITRLGYIHCSYIPGWCPIYKSIMEMILQKNYPRILIVYGDSGIGNPQKLEEIFRKYCSSTTISKKINEVSESFIYNFDVIVVEKAKNLSAEDLRMFAKFVSKGGKLIWIGDSGTRVKENEIPDKNICPDPKAQNNPWARKIIINGKPTCLKFYELLGVKYIGTVSPIYYRLVKNSDSIITKDFKSLQMYGSFAIVEDLKTSSFGVHEYLAKIETDEYIEDLNPPFPGITRSARVYYFAFPIEDLINEDVDYSVIIKRLCYALI